MSDEAMVRAQDPSWKALTGRRKVSPRPVCTCESQTYGAGDQAGWCPKPGVQAGVRADSWRR